MLYRFGWKKTRTIFQILGLKVFFREHGMKRMGNHGGLGSNQQLPVSVGSNQILGSGQNLMSDSSYQSGES